MAKLPRVTQKIFAENSGNNDVTVFGTAKNGNDAVFTKDISKIMNSNAFSQGWGSATLTDDAPFQEDMNGIQLALSQQLAYFFENGMAEWDENTTYFAKTSFCQINGVWYQSLTDNNIGNNPVSDTTNWHQIDLNKLEPDLSNLSSIGLDKLNQSKALETGSVSSDKDVYADVLKYAHSTFDASKFTVVGTPTITKDGIGSGFTAKTSYIYVPCDLSSAESWRIRIRQKFIDGNASCPLSFYSALDTDSEIFRLQVICTLKQYYIVIGSTIHKILDSCPTLDEIYDFEISYNGTQMTVETLKNGVTVQKETFEQENIFNVNGYIVIGNSLEAGIANAHNLIDLKYFLVKTDNMPFISGNKTGTYEYKQENQQKAGNVVSIPYTESKTGSKIADAIYRDRVRDMYEQYGYAPFYTIDEDNENFTLPMGEVYGMMKKTIQTVTPVGRPIFCLNGERLENNEIWLEGAEVSKAAYSQLYTLYGDTYGEATDEKMFVLPDFRGRTVWGTEDGTYGYESAGLPSIIGHTGQNGTSTNDCYLSGPFYYGNAGVVTGSPNDVQTNRSSISFDASRSNSIYGNSDTVQPPAIKVRVKTRYK